MGVEVRALSEAATWQRIQFYDEKTDGIKRTPQIIRRVPLPDCMLNSFLKLDGVGRAVFGAWQWVAIELMILFCYLVRRLPIAFKSFVLMKAWRVYLRCYCLLPVSWRTGALPETCSVEAHALQFVLSWMRSLPVPLWWVRFLLSFVSTGSPPAGARTDWIAVSKLHGLRSAYLHTSGAASSEEKRNVLFWAYGGAFVGGDVESYLGTAERYGRRLGCDVFVVAMRRCPEHSVQDVVLDVYHAYEWLLERVAPENVVILGLSSGAGATLRMLQLSGGEAAERDAFFGDRCRGRPLRPAPQPRGAAFLGAFVEYTKVTKSMWTNAFKDWLVTPGVVNLLVDIGDQICGKENRVACSPLYHAMGGICPLFLSVSNHECLIDENLELAEKAREAGVDVAMSLQPGLCHVFQLLTAFLPEAVSEELRICDWIRGRFRAPPPADGGRLPSRRTWEDEDDLDCPGLPGVPQSQCT